MSSSESQSLEATDTARSSTVSAGGNVSISASGAGRDSHLLIQGSDVTAGGNARLSAEGDVNLLAAQNTASLSGRNQSASGSVGISFGTSGFGVSASVSSSRGKEAGDDLIHTHTHITAGNTVRIQSGNDTTLQGALVKADTIQADVGGDLKIESLQDTSTYTSQQKSSSASVTVGAGVSGSFSSSKSNVKSDFASVAEQSGLKAGDGGFQVRVGGNTDLIGGAITSNQVAVEQGRNRFSTGGTLTTSDMENTAEYTAKSASVSVSGGSDETKKNTTTSGVGAGVGRDTGSASSTTRAGISGIAGDTALRSTDAETGIARILEKEAVQRDIDAQAKITEAFSREAPKAVKSYTDSQRNALKARAQLAQTDEERQTIQVQMSNLQMEERVLNILIGAVSGTAGAALTQEALSAAADQMRQLMIEDSRKFAGVVDENGTVLSNISGSSAGTGDDGVKLGGTRVDLDTLCGSTNERCRRSANGNLALNEQGQVVFTAGSIERFIETPEGKSMVGPTGGIQGMKGTLFGMPYEAGSWQDKLIEAFAGPHDYIGGSLSGLYDDQGNANRSRSTPEVFLHDRWSEVAIPVAAPFAAAKSLPPEVWRAISVLVGGVK